MLHHFVNKINLATGSILDLIKVISQQPTSWYVDHVVVLLFLWFEFDGVLWEVVLAVAKLSDSDNCSQQWLPPHCWRAFTTNSSLRFPFSVADFDPNCILESCVLHLFRNREHQNILLEICWILASDSLLTDSESVSLQKLKIWQSVLP